MKFVRALCFCIVTLALVPLASAANVLIVANGTLDADMSLALTDAGHAVAVLSSALTGAGEIPQFEGDLSEYDAVFWDASLSPTAGYNADTVAGIEAYVVDGGALFVTGGGALSTASGPRVAALLGGARGVATTLPAGVISDVHSSVTTGVQDIRGLVPLGGLSGQGTVAGLGSDTRALSRSLDGAQWTERALGRGIVAYVANGRVGGTSNWTLDAADGTGVYHAALLNFAFNSESLGRPRNVLFVSDGTANSDIAALLALDGHTVTSALTAINITERRVPMLEGDLTDYDVVVWSADGGGFGVRYVSSTIAAVQSYVANGGRMLIVGGNIVTTLSSDDAEMLGLLGCIDASVTSAALAPIPAGSPFASGLFNLVGVVPTGLGSGRNVFTGCGGGTMAAHSEGEESAAQWLSIDVGGGLGVLSNTDTGVPGAWLQTPATTDGGAAAALRNFVWDGAMFDFDGDGATLDDDAPMDGSVYPGAPELCDGKDNDGDPLTLDGSGDSRPGQACDGDDSDLCAEGIYGACVLGVLQCSDNTDSTLDLCDGVDNDCNPETPDGADEAGFGDVCDGDDSDLCTEGNNICDGTAIVCSDDSDDSIEICDGNDNDCDGAVDDEDTDITDGPAAPVNGFAYFLDGDADACGLASAPVFTCATTAPVGYVLDNSDVDDTDGVCCGNALTLGPELCDDGNTESGDGCDAGCMTEAGWACDGATLSPSSCEETCGDGVVDSLESCDDANTDNGDGCTQSCVVEEGWICETVDTTASSCSTQCGDGLTAGAERCDDGNADAGDGCGETCLPESGFACVVTDFVSACAETCGDGTVDAGEACDDGNLNDGDGCTDICDLESGWVCDDAGCSTVCGDGLVRGTEACDDGNDDADDGCDACVISEHWICADEPSTCSEQAYCGDGTIDDGEACDDGNAEAGDGCDADCSVEDGWLCDVADPTTCLEDSDNDAVPDVDDNCPDAANADQADLNADGEGDACDEDDDGDGVADADDACPMEAGDGADGCAASDDVGVDVGGDVGMDTGETGEGSVQGGSGCSAASGSSSWAASGSSSGLGFALVLLGLAVRRRRA